MEQNQNTEEKVNKVDEFLTDATDAVKKRVSNLRTQAHIVYGLYAASFFNGITLIIGVIIAYIARGNAQKENNELLIDHFTWQIRTFWWGLAFLAIIIASFVTIVLPFVIGIAFLAWFIYRIAKGWVYLSNNKRLY